MDQTIRPGLVSIRDLLESGVHFGHRTSRWNPKMAPFIFGRKNGIHIIDLEKTLDQLSIAYDAVRQASELGNDILFVGTKQQAKDVIQEEAKRCGALYVTERWLGGLLTNFTVLHSRINRLTELERVITDPAFAQFPKKEAVTIEREHKRLTTLLSGVREMDRLPGIVYIVDLMKEETALLETRRMKIPVIAIVDTNVDPELVDFPIPGNDDAMRSIKIITGVISTAVQEGRKGFETKEEGTE
jgi:small subunit ribosomal protein S2